MRDYLQTAKEFVYEEDAVGVVEIILILDQPCHYF